MKFNMIYDYENIHHGTREKKKQINLYRKKVVTLMKIWSKYSASNGKFHRMYCSKTTLETTFHLTSDSLFDVVY